MVNIISNKCIGYVKFIQNYILTLCSGRIIFTNLNLQNRVVGTKLRKTGYYTKIEIIVHKVFK